VAAELRAHRRRRRSDRRRRRDPKRAERDEVGERLSPISFCTLTAADLPRIAEIDRSEVIRVGYVVRDGTLRRIDVEWDSPDFVKEGDGPHSVASQVAFCRRHLEAGASALGAFDGERLVGIGVVTPEIRPRMAQLAYLHVSAPYRRTGIASEIAGRLLAIARERGATHVYVSSTPSQSAVGFYRRLGFEPTREPLPELYALEPDDIHMILELVTPRG
jgi:ribosomal protein S18 acetylase RimI-like enzyme